MKDDHQDDSNTPGDSNAADSSVGYGRPPRRTQFRKGRSGNLKGRPKGRKSNRRRDLVSILQELLAQPVTVRDGGREVTMTKGEAAAYRMVHHALTDPAGAQRILKLVDADRKSDNEEVQAGVFRVDRPILTTEEFTKRWGPDSLNTIAKVDAYEKQMQEACELMRKEIREKIAYRERLQERYGKTPGFKLPEW